MTSLYPDKTYPDLIWLQFDGPTWNEFHELMGTLKEWTAEADAPFYIVFYPTIDMPKGSPIPHISRMIKFVGSEDKIRHMITVVPKNMVVAKMFADLAMKLFPNQTMEATMITDVSEVHDAYKAVVSK